MEKKIIDGLHVVYNGSLTIVTLVIDTIPNLKRFLSQHENVTVLIQPISYHIDEFSLTTDNLDFLNGLDLERILLTGGGMGIDHSGLYTQVNLVDLSARFFDHADLDFSYFKKLEVIEFYWSPRTRNFFGCTSLKDISTWKYKSADKTLAEFSVFNKLEKLKVVQSNILNIDGIENLSHLRSLTLAYNTNLEIKYSGVVFENVEELEINTCRKVNLDFIKMFPNLKRLELFNFQPIPELRPILDGLPKLEDLFVGSTKIEESDNTYYLNYPNIKRFFFAEKRHHVLKNKDVGKDY